MKRFYLGSNKLRAVTGVLACALGVFSTSASATEFTRSFKIQSLAAVSTSRPNNSGAASLMRIFANTTAAWGSSTCRIDSADISMEDWHIFSVAMRAWKDNVTVNVTVESTQVIDTSDIVCKVVAIHALP